MYSNTGDCLIYTETYMEGLMGKSMAHKWNYSSIQSNHIFLELCAFDENIIAPNKRLILGFFQVFLCYNISFCHECAELYI